MKYIFGPVPSRRLGESLGIDTIPLKTCNFQCVYCQLGRTTHFTNQRNSYHPKEQILNEVRVALQENENKIDYITFVGSGEPLLCKDLGYLIQQIKQFTDIPICVITNGSLLCNPAVREELMPIDIILPSLDAADPKTFIKVNRPHPQIKYELFLQGLIDFRKQFPGQFWVEIMLMDTINDSLDHLHKLKETIDLVHPDRIDINVPIRPPAEHWVKIPKQETLNHLKEIFHDYTDINFPEAGYFRSYSENFEQELINIIKRHPMRQDQIIETFQSDSLTSDTILAQLDLLEKQKKIKKKMYNNKVFWNYLIG